MHDVSAACLFFVVCQAISTVERLVMVKLFWSSDPVLQVVHAGEPAVMDLRQRISDSLDRAFEPLEVAGRPMLTCARVCEASQPV